MRRSTVQLHAISVHRESTARINCENPSRATELDWPSLAAPAEHSSDMTRRLRLSILPQPDDTTCGPTCLQAVYFYHGDRARLADVIDGVRRLPEGGTLAPFLGAHALARGYLVKVIVYDLRVFDPSWFKTPVKPQAPADRPALVELPAPVDLQGKLIAQLSSRGGKRLGQETDAYLAFLAQGGQIEHVELSSRLLVSYLERGVPVIAGLSATYLYGLPRERPADDQFDDIDGRPAGHFVVLRGYDSATGMVSISDPMGPMLEPLHPFGSHEYEVHIERVIGAIMLGVLTGDANLLIVEKRPNTATDGSSDDLSSAASAATHSVANESTAPSGNRS